MSTHKNIDRVCIFITILAIVVTVLFMNGTSLGVVADDSVSMGYENKLFDDSYVHTIDIEIDDWESFLETATSEEYSAADVTIDGEKIKNVGIRGKGNTSLSTVAQLDSDRYSFKIEFDAYQSSTNYHGLDKLCLNNLIQDYTMMKDYLAYKLMGEFGADAPLVSFTYITVNGEDWGLYLAVEAVEDSFLERNNGTNYGNLYKPDTLSMGGGRGNGGGFDMKDIDFDELGMENPFERGSKDDSEDSTGESSDDSSSEDGSKSSENKSGEDESKNSESKSGKDSSKSSESKSGEDNSKSSGKGSKKDSGRSSSKGTNGNSEKSSEKKSGDKSSESTSDNKSMPDFSDGNFPGGDFSSADSSNGFPGGDFSGGGFPGGGFPVGDSSGGGSGGFGMGSDDAKLKYIDDDIDSYSSIFDSAKTDIKTSDKKRLIRALKSLNEGITEQDAEKIADSVNVDEVLRYMVVHNFLVNGDSYTGSMIHNYYLYEEDGLLSMIPWDYNLAYGTFQASDADSAVNDPIDTPLSITDGSTDRPMFSWITSNDEYLEMYHEYYQEFIDQFYTSGYLTDLIDSTYEMIHEYVEKDPTKFCTTEEFETAVSTIRSFVEFRCQSIQGQLDGSIGSTDSEQAADPDALIDASSINLSDMGSMGGGGGHGGGPGGDSDRGGSDRGGFPGGGNFGSDSGDSDSSSKSQGNGGFPGGFSGKSSDDTGSSESSDGSDSEMPGNPFGGDMPEGFSFDNMPGGFGGDESDSGSSSDSFSGFPGGGMPGDFSGVNMPGGFGGGDMPSFDGMQGSSISAENYIYFGVCVAVLLAAILIAYKYKARR